MDSARKVHRLDWADRESCRPHLREAEPELGGTLVQSFQPAPLAAFLTRILQESARRRGKLVPVQRAFSDRLAVARTDSARDAWWRILPE